MLSAACHSLADAWMSRCAHAQFGEGDPPGNYGRFLAKLLKGAQNGSMPLKGMQHAVLGLGSSAYETFQNCPRLSDKFLGECGSLRVAKRVELDDCGSEPDDRKEKLATFEADVLKALTSPPKASAKPVCDWTEPAKEIMEKEESDLLMFADSDSSGGGMIIGGVVLAAALAAGYAYQTGMFE
tara:strand:- start:356 stop:904 length:549 start_codon:yes stop_codon:yes gene_type:complete